MSVITILNKSAGFFSQFFFMANHFVYAIKNNLVHKIDGSNWLFNYNLGWYDYFENNYLSVNTNRVNNIISSHGNVLGQFTLSDYKQAIQMLYKYNQNIKDEIDKTQKKLDLINKAYDSIFIRRGDKMCGESYYINGEEYVKQLLKINPECKIIFLQTDDYNCYLEISEYINNNNLDINIITLCDEKMKGGVIVNNINLSGLNDLKNGTKEMTPHFHNRDYVKTVFDTLKENIPVTLMTKEQIYNHTSQMIIGIDFVLNSERCICEFSSNVSRFIKLAHKDSSKVYHVLDINKQIDWNITECPGFGDQWK